MAEREGLSFETAIISDSAPLSELVLKLFDTGARIHCMRDLTRGGLASALNEIAHTAKLGIEIREEAIPVCEEVRGACEILGLDPFYVANEGRFVLLVPSDQVPKALDVLRSHPLGIQAAEIGHVLEEHPGMVTLKNRIGSHRILDMISGEQLPRIC